MAQPVPFDPPPNTPILPDPQRDSIWRRWFEQMYKRLAHQQGGSVTSVALTMPTSVFDVSGSPITTSGTLAVTFDTQTANTVFAGPTTAPAAAPTFRALVPADIPAATPLTIGTTPIVSGTVSRLLYEGDGNLLAESGNLTFDGTILTVTGVVSVPDGSAAAPSIKIGDEQNGFFSSATSAIGLSLNGGQLFTWNTSGFTISISGGGADRRIQCVNTSNTAGSGSKLQAQVAGTSAGDAYAQFNISGSTNWSIGLDNDASDSFKISQNATLGTNDFLTITTAGAATFSGSITSSVLTSGRLALVGTSGLITDDSGITYDAAANSITATTFNGALNGNATTATTATTATNVTVADTTDTSCFVGLFESATGNQGCKTDAGLTYNASTAALVLSLDSGAGFSVISSSGNANIVVSGDTAARIDLVSGGTTNYIATDASTGNLIIVTGATTALTVNDSTGSVTIGDAILTTADINGGTVDNATIGATTPAAATVTDLTVNGNTILGSDSADSVTVNAETVSQPNIPCFLAYNSASDTNQTGAGTVATVDFDTEVFDQSSDFASDTFTAPATGKYLLSFGVRVSNLTAAMTLRVYSLITSNRNYQSVQSTAPLASGQETINLTAICDMDSGDTADVRVQISNGAGDTATIFGTTAAQTFFSGKRVA